MRLIEKLFEAYGRFLARHPWPFIIIPIIVTVLSTYGFRFFHTQDDIWDIYAPYDAPSRAEELALKRFEYASQSHHYPILVLVNRKDRGNLLEEGILNELLEANSAVNERIAVRVRENDTNVELQYPDMCGVYCDETNGGLLTLLQVVLDTQNNDAPANLTYPNTNIFGEKVFIGYSLGDLTYDDSSPPRVKEARLIVLHYMIDKNLPGGMNLIEEFESKVMDLFNGLTDSSRDLNYYLFSRNREIAEQRKIPLASIPYLGLTGVVLSAFMLWTLVDYPHYRSQHMEAIIGLLAPAMALWTAVGLVWWAGYPFSNILTVVPFMILTIGIDDAFLVLAAWRQSTATTVEQRLGDAISITGASVTVTSVTDVLCFFTGLISNMPVVRLFCVYTTACIAVDYVYQLTFFSAWVGVLGKYRMHAEETAEKYGVSKDQKFKDQAVKPRDPCSIFRIATSLKRAATSLITLNPTPAGEGSMRKTKTIVERYVDFIYNPTVRAIVVGVFLLHIGISSYLATQVTTAFEMDYLFMKDSPMTKISMKVQDHLLKDSFPVNFAVYPMPDFTNGTKRLRFEEMVRRLERIPDFTDKENPEMWTNLWLRDYAKANESGGDDYWRLEEITENYGNMMMNEKYITKSKIKSGEEVIDGFYFVITYKNFSSFVDVLKMMDIRRAILAEYHADFNISSHHTYEKVPTEAAASAPRNFLQTAISAVVLMSIVTVIFIMRAEAIIAVVLSIVSICLGTVSYLQLWGVHLESVALISTLVSIGLSVDFSAHVCYHYFAHEVDYASYEREHDKFEGTDSVRRLKMRLHHTLSGVAWPVMQCGLSSVLGILPLLLVRAYVVSVFWKTVLIVAALGMFHALVLIPVVFILTEQVKEKFSKQTNS